MKPKFSLGALLCLVIAAGVGSAALARHTPAWRDALFALFVALLAAFTIAAFFRPADRRSFAGGFALAGWIYLFIAFGPSGEVRNRNRLVTQRAADALANALIEKDNGVVSQILRVDGMDAGGSSVLQTTGQVGSAWSVGPPADTGAFDDIFHINCALVAALLGGIFAVFQARKKSAAAPPDHPASA